MTWWHNFLLKYPLKCGFLLWYFMDLFAEVSTSSKHIITVIDLLLKLQLYHMFFPGASNSLPQVYMTYHTANIQRIYTNILSVLFFPPHHRIHSVIYVQYLSCSLAASVSPPSVPVLPPSLPQMCTSYRTSESKRIYPNTYSSRISLKPLYLCGTSAL